MNDLISREAAIAHAISGLTREFEGEKWIRVSEVRESLQTMPPAQSNIARDIATIIENEKDMRVLLNAQPSAGRQGHWIPVTEKLPEERGTYLVTVVDGTIKRALAQWWYDVDNGEGFFACDDCYAEDIVAWMPLPEPYKGGEEEC